jgi:hypothetical protein
MLHACWSICTPTGAAGAIAVFQIEGDIDAALDALSLPPMNPGEVKLRPLCGVDEGLAVRWDHSTLHLMPHAGAQVQLALGERLIALGIGHAPPGSFPRYPEARDGLEELMLIALARAASPLAIDLLLDQPRRWGARPAHVDSLAPRAVLERLINPPLVVALGPTNIGKSTLVNALAGRAVSIVADEPGTTRDHVGVTLDLGGLVVRYADTPGLRPDASAAEREAADIALRLAESADLVLLCGDASIPPPALALRSGALRVALRTDLGTPAWPHDAGVCAPRAEGIPALVTLMRNTLVSDAALTDPRPWEFWVALGLEEPGAESVRGPTGRDGA